MRSIFAVLLLCALSSAPAHAKRAKNVILLLADAGGVSTVNAASILGYDAPQKLYIQSWPNVALSDTSTASRWVSDSAAGMTAIVTGHKTHNGVISQGPDGERGKRDGTAVMTILEYAERHGLATGVISNMPITDATPGACYAHVNDRGKWGEIFQQLLTPRIGDGVDILFGPGRKRIWDLAAKSNIDLDRLAREKNRPVLTSLDEVEPGARRALVVVDSGFDLNRAVKMAIPALAANKKGFFLMIESDAHTDNPEAGLGRLVAFDKLIREIAGMVNLKETLLLFTADHSFDLRLKGGTRGEPILKGLDDWKQKGAKGPVRIPAMMVDGSHTGEEVVAAATGPGSERVKGFLSNTDLFKIMMAAYGWKE
ncbi:MAG: alkaline phosphatase [Bryobacteraceae bacterium]